MKKGPDLKLDPLAYIDAKGIERGKVRQNGWLTLKNCPFCDKAKKFDVNIDPEKNSFESKFPKGFVSCYVCGNKGGFEKLVAQVEGIDERAAFGRCYGSKRKAKRNYRGPLAFLDEDEGDPVELKNTPESWRRPLVGEILRDLPETRLPDILIPVREGGEAFRYLAGRGMEKSEILACQTLECPYDYRGVKNFYREKFGDDRLWDDCERLVKERKDLPEMDAQKRIFFEDFLEARKLIGRVVFPVAVHGRTYGYVARAWGKDFVGPKVLNSSGPLTSSLVWNWQAVTRARRLVICEGIFDATTVGIDCSVAYLGKGVSASSKKIDLISSLRPEEVVVYFDPGALSDAAALARILSERMDAVVKVAFPPPLVENKNPPDREQKALLEPFGVATESGGEGELWDEEKKTKAKLMLRGLKMKLEGKSNAEIGKNLKNMRWFSSPEQRASALLAARDALYHEKPTELAAALERLMGWGYLDANDLGKKRAWEVIEAAQVYHPFMEE